MERPAPLDTDVLIETPEHVVFRHRVAGPGRRFCAFLIDLVLCYGVAILVGVILLVAAFGAGQLVDRARDGVAASAGLLLVLLFGIQWVYFAALEARWGTTPGKAALGMRVMTAEGRPIGLRAAALRNILRAADALPLAYTAGLISFAGLAFMSVSRRFQRLGDLVANTMVVVSERAAATAPVVLSPPADSREIAQLEAEVRLDADERLAVELFLRRRDRLGPARALELATMLKPLIVAHGPRLSAMDASRALALLYDQAQRGTAHVATADRDQQPSMLDVPGTITEADFCAERRPDWERLDSLVRKAHGRAVRSAGTDGIERLSPLYLDVCSDLARAQAARFGAPLVDYLHGLTAAAHSLVYARHVPGSAPRARLTLRIALEAFPRAVRRHQSAMLVSLLLFFVPFVAGLLATMAEPRFALKIVPEAMLQPLVHAYREGFDSGRGAGLDAAMAGFYVNNNVGIALRCFATGLALGIGTAVYLVKKNGITTGAVVGYVSSHGGGANIVTFIAGHGSLELGAIVMAGGAGLAMGWSIVAPGDRTRLESLQATAKSLFVVVVGATIMLFMAAAIEGFWSMSSVPPLGKRVTGALIAALLVTYVAFGGRGSEQADALERAGHGT